MRAAASDSNQRRVMDVMESLRPFEEQRRYAPDS
jgi:hypothetical protein